MKRRILLPTDFSKNAWSALKYAAELYKYEEVDFYVLNAFKVKSYDIESIVAAKPGDAEYDEALSYSEINLLKTLKRIEKKKCVLIIHISRCRCLAHRLRQSKKW